jgi:O-antigen polymerase
MIVYVLLGNRNYIITPILLSTSILTLIAILFFPLHKLYNAYSLWDEAGMLYNIEAYDSSIVSFEEAYEQLNTNGEFLIMYGKALAMSKQYDTALRILQDAQLYKKNSILYTTLGDCYKATSRYKCAENSYITAQEMIPSRFYPSYLLAILFSETGQNDKAKLIAQEILEKKVKIESEAIKEIREEMEKLIH